MHIALSVKEGCDDQLIFAQQLGVDHVVVEVESWDADTLAAARNRVEKTELQLVGVESLPTGPLDQACQAIENIGTAGIPLVSYRWPSPDLQHPEPVPAGRGGVLVAEYSAAARPSESHWEDLARFLERALPAAERAGVCLACRPDSSLNVNEDLHRLVDMAPASHHGLDLCSASLAAGDDVAATIDALIAVKKLFMVHLRNLHAAEPRPRNAFLDEGDIDIPRLLQILHAAGFDGPVRAAQPPGMDDDPAWGHKGRSFDIGYIKAILQVVQC